jgi:hypothetical protein
MGRAPDRELKPAPFSRAAGSDRHDEVTSTARGGQGVDHPNMSLQSTAALGLSPLHAGAGDGSSSKDTSTAPPYAT